MWACICTWLMSASGVDGNLTLHDLTLHDLSLLLIIDLTVTYLITWRFHDINSQFSNKIWKHREQVFTDSKGHWFSSLRDKIRTKCFHLKEIIWDTKYPNNDILTSQQKQLELLYTIWLKCRRLFLKQAKSAINWTTLDQSCLLMTF